MKVYLVEWKAWKQDPNTQPCECISKKVFKSEKLAKTYIDELKKAASMLGISVHPQTYDHEVVE